MKSPDVIFNWIPASKKKIFYCIKCAFGAASNESFLILRIQLIKKKLFTKSVKVDISWTKGYPLNLVKGITFCPGFVRYWLLCFSRITIFLIRVLKITKINTENCFRCAHAAVSQKIEVVEIQSKIISELFMRFLLITCTD